VERPGGKDDCSEIPNVCLCESAVFPQSKGGCTPFGTYPRMQRSAISYAVTLLVKGPNGNRDS